MRALLSAAALVLAVATGPTAVHAQPSSTVQVSGDKFSKDITFLGPAAAVNPFGGTFRMWRIRSFLNRETKAVTHQLYVDISYAGDWRWYDLAAADMADTLKSTRIASHVGSCAGGCTLSETTGVDLPDTLLRTRATSGFQVKLSARNGDSLILDVTPAMIASQLQTIDSYVGLAATGATSAIPLPAAPFGVDFGAVNGLTRAMLKIDGGALVGWVHGDSVSARAGLHWADIIVQWDGEVVKGPEDIKAKLAVVRSGQKITLGVIRGRQTVDLVAQF